MRASLPPITAFEAIVDKLRHHQSEVAVFSGMLASLGLVTGGALSMLFSPNLGQQLYFPSMLKPNSLQEGHISKFGNTLLELSRPLRIEIVEGTTSVDREATSTFAETQDKGVSIVSPAEFQPQLLEEAHDKGTRLLLLILIATGGLYGAIRLSPYLPFGPKRRRPLGERLAGSPDSISTHPLAVKPIPSPFSMPVRRKRNKPYGVTSLLINRKASTPKVLDRQTSDQKASNPKTSDPKAFETNNFETNNNVAIASSVSIATTVIPPNAFSSAEPIQAEQQSEKAALPAVPLVLPSPAPSTDWLGHLDVRQDHPLNTIL